jgi:hypothetical protein
MKKTFAICLCLIPLLALSQKFKPLDCLTLIKFGSSKSAVVETIKAARGVWDVQYSRPQYYVFTHLAFDNKSKSLFIVKFTAGKAYETDYIIYQASGVNVLSYYCEIIQKINAVYGKPKSDKQYKPPCRDGSTNEIKAIKLGFAYYSCYWPAGGNSIIISIDTRLRIILTIQDNKLTNQAFENQNAVN